MAKLKRWHVNLVVEVDLVAADASTAAREAERRIQAVLDTRQKSLGAVVGADHGDVQESQ